ncbi:glycosyltransferase [Rhodococcus sp. JVH1]|uniref:glycosyltransferase n=1 Tax=Rhodococcus sp. JVH1 TaxID=745408 RepID=UPI000271E5CF|nr:glycosyltransferase [Rhodococcus sp. JVH1]EJI94375.1 glycosyl transferases group 1 family protein [Rhodococcus sp. JVH1]
MTTTQPDPTTTEASIPVRCDDRPPDRTRVVTAAGVTAATAELTAVIGDHTPRGPVTTVPPGKQRRPSPLDPKAARSLVGLADLPTIVAVGPFDDHVHAEQLAAAFTRVRRQCEAQLVLVGTGSRCGAIDRAIPHNSGNGLHLVEDSSGQRWPELLAAADLVVPSTTSGATRLLEVLAAGRAVVTPEHPDTVGLVVPTSAGLVYRRGDVYGMTEAILRVLTAPALRDGMAARAREVAHRHHCQDMRRRTFDHGNGRA